MIRGPKKRAILLWGVAGIPILAGTIQSISALDIGPLEEMYVSQLPVIGGVVERFLGFEIFLQIGFDFVAADAIVYILFLLIAAAWVAFGATFFDGVPLRRVQRKNVRIAAIGLSGIVYAVLFYWVFRGIFFLEVPALQRVAFGSVPLLVVGALVLSWRTAPNLRGGWGSRLEDELERKQTTFENEFENRLEPALNDLEELSFDRTDIFDLRDERGEFETKCEELADRIDAIRADIADGDERLSEAHQIESDVEAIAPEAHIERLEDQLRDDLRGFYDNRYAAFWEYIESPYGESYGTDIVNVSDYDTIYLPSAVAAHIENGGLYIRNIDAIRMKLLQQDVPVRDAVSAFAKLEEHIYGDGGLIPHIDEQETAFTEAGEELQSTLENTESVINELDGELRRALQSRFVDGEGASVSVASIRKQRQRAVESLNECLFESATDEIRSAVETADELYETVDTLNLAVSTAKNDRGYIDLPSSLGNPGAELDYDDVEAIREAFVAATGRTFTVDRHRNRLEFEKASQPVESPSADTTGAGGRNSPAGRQNDSPDPVEIRNDAYHHLQRLRTGVRKDSDFVDVPDDRHVTMQVDAIADMYQQDGVYEELDSFLATQDPIEDHTLRVNENGTGHIEITTVPDSDPRLCIQQLVENYENKLDV